MDDQEENHFFQKDHDIKHDRVLGIVKISGDNIHRVRIKTTFELQKYKTETALTTFRDINVIIVYHNINLLCVKQTFLQSE